MVHPALLRTSDTRDLAAGRSPTADSLARAAGETARALLGRLNLWWKSGYRPERHYMRGGRTMGAKSLAAG